MPGGHAYHIVLFTFATLLFGFDEVQLQLRNLRLGCLDLVLDRRVLLRWSDDHQPRRVARGTGDEGLVTHN